MSELDKKRYGNYIAIIIVAVFLLEMISKVFDIDLDLKGLIINFLFAIGYLFLLFGWEFKVFVLLNVFGFIKFNIGLITNNLIKPDWILGKLDLNLQLVRLIITVITLLIIAGVFQKQMRLDSWRENVVINKKKTVTYYILGTIFLQFIIRLFG